MNKLIYCRRFTLGLLILLLLGLQKANAAVNNTSSIGTFKLEEAGQLEWYMKTDSNKLFPMSRVGMLVAADDSPYFSILDINGNVLAEDVLRVHFLQLDPSGVEDIMVDKPQNMLKSYVNNQLTLIGASGMVTVYSLSGMEVASTLANGRETILDLSALPEGTYVLKCGKQSFKFNKK